MDKVERGRRAESLLKDPLLQQTFQQLEESYIEAWRKAKTLEAREDAHRFMGLIGRFHDHLASLSYTGKLSAKQSAELEGRDRFWR